MMKTNEYIDSKYCLNQNQMIRYLNNQVSDKETILIKKHLSTCELCQDAVAGLSVFENTNKVQKSINGINKRIRHSIKIKSRSLSNRPTDYKLHRQISYASIAAALILFFAVFAYIQLFIPNKDIAINQIVDVKEKIPHENNIVVINENTIQNQSKHEKTESKKTESGKSNNIKASKKTESQNIIPNIKETKIVLPVEKEIYEEEGEEIYDFDEIIVETTSAKSFAFDDIATENNNFKKPVFGKQKTEKTVMKRNAYSENHHISDSLTISPDSLFLKDFLSRLPKHQFTKPFTISFDINKKGKYKNIKCLNCSDSKTEQIVVETIKKMPIWKHQNVAKDVIHKEFLISFDYSE